MYIDIRKQVFIKNIIEVNIKQIIEECNKRIQSENVT